MFPNITVVQLRCFRGVAEQGSFTAAASHLCLSQSAVSQAVAGLERSLNASLLARGRDGVTLTAAGIAALAEARVALAAIERIAACIGAASILKGSLRVGVVQSAAIRLLPTWMRRLRIEHPGIVVTLYEGTDPEVTAWVLAGVVEVGVTSRTHPVLTAKPVYQDDYVVVVPTGHPLAVRTSIGLKDLDGERMLLSGGGCETLIEELLMAAASHPDIVCIVRDNATLVSMVREGLGLTIMPELALPTACDGVELVRLRPNLRRTLHVLTRPHETLGPTITAFLELVDDPSPMELGR
jgi:DNA-binding transcriptional LysR family regulator